jgi:hypothetical protein
MFKKGAVVLVAMLAFAGVTEAQELYFKVEAGPAYSDVNTASFDNLGASVYLSGAGIWRLQAGSVVDVSFANGGSYQVFARGSVTVTGPIYAATDVPINGDNRDPRAVFGLNFGRFNVEGYGRIGEDRLYGIAARWKLPF